MILEEVGLGKVVESVREQVCMPSQSSCQSCTIGVKNVFFSKKKQPVPSSSDDGEDDDE